MNGLLVIGALFFSIQAIRAKRLLESALYLAGVSALTSILLYLLGAGEVAVIELSVGAGLVTVLFVFAIAIAGDDALNAPSLVPKILSWLLVLGAIVLLGWLALPLGESRAAGDDLDFANLFWNTRGLDALVQIGLIFSGVIGILGLLVDGEKGSP